MDLIKIGKFIADCRKKKNITQEQLAEKLYITDRAVSKWERGLSLPDADKMLDLCNILDISVNELLNGEKIDMKDYEKKTEELLVELAKQDELKNRKLMTAMWTILITSLAFYLGILLIAVNTLEEGWLLGVIICTSTILLLIAGFIALKLEVEAGYYECKNCHHMFVPNYKEIILVLQTPTRRLLKCSECNKWTWCKKISKR
jgi:transcriptional regulator with XRE-family HTH domain